MAFRFNRLEGLEFPQISTWTPWQQLDLPGFQ